jgi:hypothetical protein
LFARVLVQSIDIQPKRRKGKEEFSKLMNEEKKEKGKREEKKSCFEPNRKCQVLFTLVVYHAALKGQAVDINSYM